MPVVLPELPYERDALAPHISAKTLEFHHGKHHRAYVEKTNQLIEGTSLAEKPLEEIIRAVAGDERRKEIFNNAAQAWNHEFYWNSMAPDGGGAPSGEIAALLKRDFGGYDGFREAFFSAGKTQFASGWAWLVKVGGKLEVRNSDDARTPIEDKGVTPLLTMDVWEHAYYLDVQNERPKYIDAFLDHLVNWDFARDNLKN